MDSIHQTVVQQFRWENPSAFWFILLLFFLIFIRSVFDKKNKKTLESAFGHRVLPWLNAYQSSRKKYLKLSVQLLAFLFLILAWARPQWGKSEQEIKSEGIELMILADVSESMLAEDLKPSRLEQMKIDLSKLVELTYGHRIGIIAFAGSSALLSPLTSDPSALRMYIDSLDPYSISSQGTSIETALSHAVEAFEKGGLTQSQNVQTTRVVLVASDGEDHEPGAIEEAKKLKEKGIRVITLAYGTPEGATIPRRDAFGNLVGPKKNKQGENIITKYNPEFLKDLAQTGQGEFFISDYTGQAIEQIHQLISQYEQTQFESKLEIQYDEQYAWPLVMSLFLFCISTLIQSVDSKSKKWRGRYEYEKNI